MSTKNLGNEALIASWDVYAYEANPVFNEVLEETRKKVSQKHTVHIYNETAAWTYDGTIDFFLDTVNKKRHFWGSSLNKNHPDVVQSGTVKITVKCHDIARLIKQYRLDDLVVIKIDIEGAEYDLLLDFLRKDAFSLIDFIAVEFHPSVNRLKTPESVFKEILNIYGTKYVDWN